MIALVSVLIAFPLGYKLRSRLAANVIFIAAYSWSFTYQTLYLLLGSEGGEPAFEPDEFPLSYGLVTLSVYLVGFGLVALGHRVATRGQRSAGRSL